MYNNVVKSNRRFHFRNKTTENPNKINQNLLNELILNKSLSTNRKMDYNLKPKIKINKKIGIPISPNINCIFSKKIKTKDFKRTKSESVSTSDATNKTKKSRISNTSSSNVNPFIIYDEPNVKEEKGKTIISKEGNQDYIRLNDIFHLKNYQTNLNKYSKIKPKFTKQTHQKKLGKLIYSQMNHKFYDSKISIRSSRDKTIEEESNRIKQILRFWKGVFDISFPIIITDKIKTQYESNYFKRIRNKTYSFREIKF